MTKFNVTKNIKITLSLIACNLLFSLPIVMLNTRMLLNNMFSDDAFYFMKIAKNIASGLGPTFDGINRTNGFQPLWGTALVPLFWLFPTELEVPLRAVLLIQAILNAFTTIQIYRLARLGLGEAGSFFAAIFWATNLSVLMVMLNGLESSLYALLLTTTSYLIITRFTVHSRQITWKTNLLLGMLLGLTFLARLDSGFFVLSAIGFVFGGAAYPSLRKRVESLVVTTAPLALLSVPYLAWNYLSFGAIMPVSGGAKAFMSQQAFQRAVVQGGSPIVLKINNLFWPVFNVNLIVFVGFFVALTLWLVVVILPKNRLGQHFSWLKPWSFFVVALLPQYLFYTLYYHRPYSLTGWYYVPEMVIGAVVIGALFELVVKAIHGREGNEADPQVQRRVLILGAIAVGFFAMLYLSKDTAFVLARLFYNAREHSGTFERVLPAVTRIYDSLSLSLLLFGSALIVERLLLFVKSLRLRGRTLTVTVLLVCFLVLNGASLGSRIYSKQEGFGVLVYDGAIWLRENTPKNSRIASWNAGILGYFSERSVINIDGMANSHNFLAELKTGRLMEFLEAEKVEFVADVRSDEWLVRDGVWRKRLSPIEMPPEIYRNRLDYDPSRYFRVYRFLTGSQQ